MFLESDLILSNYEAIPFFIYSHKVSGTWSKFPKLNKNKPRTGQKYDVHKVFGLKSYPWSILSGPRLEDNFLNSVGTVRV